MAVPQATVLIVEDEPLIRLTMAAAAEDAGYRVLEACNALEAVGVISRSSIDALITDVDMPGGLTGLDLAELVSAVTSATIVVVSGRPLPQSYHLPNRAIYLPKPYDLDEVLSKVGEYISTVGGSELKVAAPSSPLLASLWNS